MNAQFDFTGKKVVITGAAGNYASWVAAAFHRANAELWLVDIDGKELENVANTLTGSAKVYTSTMDLTVEENIQQLQREMEAAWQSPDFLINTAALMPGSLMLDLSTEIFDKMFFLNVRTPFWMTKYMSQLMIKYEVKGAIVNFICAPHRFCPLRHHKGRLGNNEPGPQHGAGPIRNTSKLHQSWLCSIQTV